MIFLLLFTVCVIVITKKELVQEYFSNKSIYVRHITRKAMMFF